MDKYIFLDCDGVITTPETKFKLTHDSQSGIGKIIKATGAKIVLSSSWRLNTLKETIEYMKQQGFEFCDYLI